MASLLSLDVLLAIVHQVRFLFVGTCQQMAPFSSLLHHDLIQCLTGLFGMISSLNCFSKHKRVINSLQITMHDDTYLSEGNSAVLIPVHFINDLGRLHLADVEAARLNQALELIASDTATIVHVKGVKSIVDVEIGHALETLTHSFGRDLTAEVLAPDSAELKLGIGQEAIITAV